jgi:hypothetical protein
MFHHAARDFVVTMHPACVKLEKMLNLELNKRMPVEKGIALEGAYEIREVEGSNEGNKFLRGAFDGPVCRVRLCSNDAKRSILQPASEVEKVLMNEPSTR